MAQFYPLIIEGVRFFVNPTQLKFNTQTVQNEVNTLGGPAIQYWYPKLTTLQLVGYAGGTRAYRELLNLRTNFFEKGKKVRIFYKTSLYNAVLTLLEVSHVTEEHMRFRYQINAVFLEPFKMEDFAINETGKNPFTIGFLRGITKTLNETASKFDERTNKFLQKQAFKSKLNLGPGPSYFKTTF